MNKLKKNNDLLIKINHNILILIQVKKILIFLKNMLHD